MTPRVAPIAAVAALCAGAVLAAFGVIAPLVHWIVPPTELPPPFDRQNQDAETLTFLLTLAVALPAAVVAVPRLADRVAARPGGAALSTVAVLATDLLLALLVLLRVSDDLPWGEGLGTLLALSLVWFAAVGAGLAWCTRAADAGVGARLERAQRSALLAAAPLGAAAALSFTDVDSIEPVVLIAGILAVGLVVAIRRRSLPALSGLPGLAVDAVAVVLLLLVVPNLVIFEPEDPALGAITTVIQFHQDFFLGPANNVLGGEAMLVETLSQYGVGSILFLGAAFQVFPIGNGTLGLIEGLLSAGVFALAYGILRGGGAGRVLAIAAMMVAVVALVLNLVYPVGALLQHGALRFGLPIVPLAAALLAVQRPSLRVPALAVGLFAVGLSSIWALEAFAYTVITVAGLVLFEMGRSPGARLRVALTAAAWSAAACLIAHGLFAGLTLLFAGELPDWSLYLETLRAFLNGGVGDLTYDFTRWSSGLPLAALYIASACAIAVIVRRAPEFVEAHRAELLTLSGATAYGIALFSYLVNRSADHIVPYVALPALIVVTLWLALMLETVPRRTATAALASVAALAALLVSVAWSSAGDRFNETALASLPPGEPSLRQRLDRLWDPPELAPGSAEAARLLAEEMPGEEESLVLTETDLGIEALMETERTNLLPFADPWEESLVPELHEDALEEAVDDLRPGQLVLTDPDSRAILEAAGRGEDVEVIGPEIVPQGIAPLQIVITASIGERFRVVPVVRGADGFEVGRLVPS